ncbi:class I SAM-dependent methyltransferase [Pseudonocardia zijingensis]
MVRLLHLSSPVGLALDLGCGTGMSTRAVKSIAEQVVAVDASRPMLEQAAPSPGVAYIQAKAERLPVRGDVAELVVTAAAFHWFDQDAVLAEVGRVLRPGGAFVTYTDFFSGNPRDATACTEWLAETYRARFPAPARRSHFDQRASEAAGLGFVGHEELGHDVPMTAAGLTDYLMTQSNATSAIDAGRVSHEELRRWLVDEIGSRLPEPSVMAEFTGDVWCCRKQIP